MQSHFHCIKFSRTAVLGIWKKIWKQIAIFLAPLKLCMGIDADATFKNTTSTILTKAIELNIAEL